MNRVVGVALLLAGGAAAGFGAVRRLEARVSDLDGMIVGLKSIKRELEWRLAPLAELMGQAAEETRGRVSVFFQECRNSILDLGEKTFCQQWNEQLTKARLELAREECIRLEQLGSVLGRYDGESQQRALDETVSELKKYSEQAAERRSRLGKVYGALGLTGGAFLAILLL